MVPGHQLGTELVGGWLLFLIHLWSLSRPQAHPGAWSHGAAGATLPCTSCPLESSSRETVSICERCEQGRAGCSRTDVSPQYKPRQRQWDLLEQGVGRAQTCPCWVTGQALDPGTRGSPAGVSGFRGTLTKREEFT